MWLKLRSTHCFFRIFFKKSHLHLYGSCFHAQSSLSDYLPLPLPHGTPRTETPTAIHSFGGQFGRLAGESPLTGYEPNDPVEVSSSEVTPMLFVREDRISGR